MSAEKRKRVALIGCWGYGNIGDDTYPQIWRKAFPDVDFVTFNSDLPKEYPDADLYLFGGGGVIYDNGTAHFEYMATYMDAAMEKGIPFAFASVGMQALETEDGYMIEPVLERWGPYLREASFVTVRDNYSGSQMQRIGVDATVAPDLCYMITGVSPSEDHFLTVIPAIGCSPRYSQFHDKLEEMRKKYPQCPLVVMNMGAEDKADIYVDEIAAKYPVIATFKSIHLTTDMTAEVIRLSQFVMTGRFHGLIFARAARKNFWIPQQGVSLKLKEEDLTSDLAETIKHVEILAEQLGVAHNALPPENFR